MFKSNSSLYGNVEKNKERLYAKVCSQVEGIKFSEIFSLVQNLTSIKLLLFVALGFSLEIEYMDVKTILLNGY